MEESNIALEENSKLCSFNGYIGRHDYILNIIYIMLIATVLGFPYSFWVLTNLSNFSDIFSFNQIGIANNIPLILKIWILITTAAIFPVKLSNIIRRLNDICGKYNKVLNAIAVIYCIIETFSMLIFPAYTIFIIGNISLVIGLLLMCIPGKLTSQKPYDVTKIFNWGAFLGTWIWGLFNKSYKTLWFLLLGLIPYIGFYFQLICGMKGNEWAFKNMNWVDVVEFNKTQKRQTAIWAIIAAVVVPILYFLFIIAIVAVIAVGIQNEVKTNGKEATLAKIENIAKGIYSAYFESYEITETENKFYISPSEWSTSTFSIKKDIFEAAVGMAILERNKKFPQEKGKLSKSSEYPRTKIYSSENGELLGEFVPEESIPNAEENSPIKSAMSIIKAYKFYQPTNK